MHTRGCQADVAGPRRACHVATMQAEAPREVLDDLSPDEPVFFVAPARLAASPGDREGLPGVAVLTSERLAFVPGAAGSPKAIDDADLDGGPLREGVAELWTLVRPIVLTAFPIARLLVRQPP